MSQLVDIPGVGKISFPDNMSHEDISAAIQKNYPDLGKPAPLTKEEILKKAVQVVGKGPYISDNQPVGASLGNINVGLAQMLGLPADLTNTVFNLPGIRKLGLGHPGEHPGTDFYQNLFHKLGAAPAVGQEGHDANSIAQQNIVPFLFPEAALAAKGAREITKIPEALSTLGQAARTVVENPAKSLGTGLGASYTSAVGQKLGDKFGPTGAFTGALIGGSLPSLASSVAKGLPGIARSLDQQESKIPYYPGKLIAYPALKGGLNAGKELVKGFTRGGAYDRAQNRLNSLLSDTPEQVSNRLQNPQTLPNANLSASQLSGEPGLMALERAHANSSPALSSQFDQNIGQANQAVHGAMGQFGGAPQSTRDYFINNLTKIADNAKKQIDAISPNVEPQVARQQASSIAESHLQAAKDVAKQYTDKIWRKVPQSASVPVTSSKTAFDNIEKTQAVTANPQDIPGYVRQFLGPDGLGTKAKAKDLITLRSRMLDDIAAERAQRAPNYRKIAILNDLQGSVLNDLRTNPAVAKTVDKALAATRDFHQRFNQGPVARIMSYDPLRNRVTPPEATLDPIFSQTGGKQTAIVQQLLKASTDVKPQIEDFLRAGFAERATGPNGLVKPDAAQRFINKNAAVLDMFPDLKGQLSNASKAQAIADEALSSATSRNPLDKNISVAALYLNAPVGEEISRVMRQTDPQKTMGELIQKTKEDTSGQAINGLKAQFSSWLLDQSKLGQVDANGAHITSGKTLERLIKDHQPVINQLYTKDEQRRLQLIANTAKRIETATGSLPDVGGVSVDGPSKVLKFVIGVYGAREGAKLGGHISGASLKTASAGSKAMTDMLTNILTDKSKDLLVQSITDPKLMRHLLTRSGLKSTKIMRNLQPWLVGPASRYLTTGAPQTTEGQQTPAPK